MFVMALMSALAGTEERRLAKIRLLVFSLGLAMSLLAVLVIWRQQSLVVQSNDPFGFAEIGSNLAHGRGFFQVLPTTAGPAIHYARRGPSYPFMIAALYLIGGDHMLLVQLTQCVLVGGICVIIFEISLRMFANVRAGLISACLYAFHPMILRYAPDIQVEVLLTFLLALAVLLSLRFMDNPSFLNGALFGAACAAAALTKPVALPYAVFFVIIYILVARGLHRRKGSTRPAIPWVPLSGIFVAMAVMILPWSYRNYRVLDGQFVLISSNAGGEFLRGYIFTEPDYFLLRKGATTDAEGRANEMEIDMFAAQGKVWLQHESETERILNRAAKGKLVDEPLAFLQKAVVNAFMFWYVATTRFNSLLVGALALGGWLLAIVALRRVRAERLAVWPIVLPIATLNLTYAALLALARYSAPIIPMLMILAGFGIETLLEGRGSARLSSARAGDRLDA